ncbi:MAG: HAD family phosphatase [Clostridia bacterium]|nr:HAD family phosphatase [Clostridia bacterium]
MYKIIAIDLDGTLLNSFGEITPNTKEVLKKAIEKGAQVVLASGRPVSAIENIANEIGAEEYLISGNGALVYDIKEKKIVYDKFLSKEQVLEIVDICEENSIYCNVYTEQEVIAKSLNYNVLFYHKENAKKPEGKRTNINIVSNLRKYIEELSADSKFLKVTVCDPNRLIFNGIIRKLRNIETIDVLDVSHMSRKTIKDGTDDVQIEYFYTEITNKNVNKWSAIEYLLEKENIKPEEVMAIGDNVNDKEMIQNAGLGVVMGNSSPQMKEMADIVVSDNNSDGIVEAVEKFILS